LGENIANSFAGTSGPLYGIFFSQASLKISDVFEISNVFETF
jgi:hypothetical protein